jgi:L-ascorbate metabolism protein UlaG (beta-lactamase superfamily)
VFLPGPPAITVDPWRWRYDELRASLLLVTHAHVDHCCADDLRRAAADGAIAAGPAACAPVLRATFGERARVLAEGDTLEIPGATVRALPHAGDDATSFHPRGEGLAYLVESNGSRYLFLGDSVALPEHEGLTPDVAFFATGGLTVPDADAAASGALRVCAALSVPIHWGDLHGRHDAARRFTALCGERGK